MVVVVGRLLSRVVGVLCVALLMCVVSVEGCRWWLVRVALGGGGRFVAYPLGAPFTPQNRLVHGSA